MLAQAPTGLGLDLPLTALAGVGNEIVLNELGRYQHIFWRSGQNIFIAVALILLVWHGVETALDGVDKRRTGRLLLALSFGWVMIHYYATTIPGIGYSFAGLIQQQPQVLANQLDLHGMGLMQQHLRDIQGHVSAPPFWQVHYMLTYLALQIAGVIVAAIALFVVLYGAIGQAVCLILGPLFLPWFLVPRLDFLFWSWLRSILQFSFYQVVAAIVAQLVARLLVTFLDPGSISADWADLALKWPLIAGVEFVAAFTLYKIPAITNSLFTGASAGDSGALQAATGGVSRAASAAAA